MDITGEKLPWPNELCLGDRKAYDLYKAHCVANNMKAMPKPGFTRAMKKSKFIQDGSQMDGKQRRWIGVQVNPSMERVQQVQDGEY